MATLYLGRSVDAPEEPLSAIKVIHPHMSEDWQFVRMFVDEALISVRLRHPNVVRVDELGEEDDVYYLVMEYVHGCSLAQLLRAMATEGRRMRPDIALWIAREVAAGLHAAHEMTGHDGALLGVVHRDVSPQNVLLSSHGQVKLLDFGIAKARDRADRTETGVIKGKLRYMAPEQATGRDIDRRVDIYALGVVLWEMLTMRRYIEARNDAEVLRKVQSPDLVPPSFRAEGIDSRIDDVVLEALAVSPERRSPTAAALAQRLNEALDASAVGPPEVAELLRLFAAEELRTARATLERAGGGGPQASGVTRELTITEKKALTSGMIPLPPPEDDVLGAMPELDDEVARPAEEPAPQPRVIVQPEEPRVIAHAAADDAVDPEEPTAAALRPSIATLEDPPAIVEDDEPTTLDPATPQLAALLERAREGPPADFTRPPEPPPDSRAHPRSLALPFVLVATLAFVLGLLGILASMHWP